MRIKSFIHEYLHSPFFNHFIMIINFVLFVSISYISLALDARNPFNLINIALVSAFIAITIIYMIINKIKPKMNIFIICTLGLVLCYLFSYAINGFDLFPKTPMLLAIFSAFIFLWLDSNRKYLNLYLIAFLIASWMFAMTFVVFEYSSIIHPSLSSRAGVSLGNENDVARHLLFAFLINLYYIYATKKRAIRVFFILICVVIAYFVVLTGSISNLLLLLLSFFIFSFFSSSKKKGIIIVSTSIAIIALLIALVFSLPALSSLKHRVMSIVSALFKVGNERQDSSALSRFSAMTNAFRLFFESPLFGNGFNSVVNNYNIMAHNNIAEIGADFGVFALLFEEIIILYPFIKDEKASQKGKILTVLFGFYIFMVQFFLVVFNSKVESIILPLLFVAINDDFDLKTSAKTLFEAKEEPERKIKKVQIKI